jgi:16S rRNA (cytosine1402-N4)-methyltransferase
VLLLEVVEGLARVDGGRYVDCTVGAGGHASALLECAGPTARLLGIDADAEILAFARARLAPFGDRIELAQANFVEVGRVAEERGFHQVDGVLFDLGVSSLQLDQAERGFSFQADAPLDMRLDRSQARSARELVRDLSERELSEVIFGFGEEPRARQVARAIVAARRRGPIETTGQLAELIRRVVPRGRTDSATRTFQALRIAVNDELDALRAALRQGHALLRDGGRLAVIAFHSLEDRIVKGYFAAQAKTCICPPRWPVCTCGRQPTLRVVTRKPATPGAAELAGNPRARSARLRIAERLAAPI